MSKKKYISDGSIKSIHGFHSEKRILRPLIGTQIPAGFPSPAQDYVEGTLDLNELLLTHPYSTFFVRVDGYSMINAGIFPDDILIVDRSLEAVHNKIVIAVVNGELTVKRLRIEEDRYWLYPENAEFNGFEVTEDIDFYVWGVVTYVIHKL